MTDCTKCECDKYWYCISDPGASHAGAWVEWKPDWPPKQTTEIHIMELFEQSTDHIGTLAEKKRHLDKYGKTMIGWRNCDTFKHLYVWNNCAKEKEDQTRIENARMTTGEKQAKWAAQKEEEYQKDLATWSDWHQRLRGTDPVLSDNKHFIAKD